MHYTVNMFGLTPPSRRVSATCWLVGCLSLVAADWARGDIEDPAARTAAYLISESMTVHRNGKHNVLIRALRHLRDPALRPYFTYLADQDNPVLKIHGIMGLAECTGAGNVDLVRVAAIDRAPVQVAVVGTALDSDLLSDDAARQLINWPGLDEGVKVAAALPLVTSKDFEHMDLLRSASRSDKPSRAVIATVMLLQAGDDKAMTRLEQLDRSNSRLRDPIRLAAMQTILRFNYDRAAPWALKVARENKTNRNLRLIALHAALRFRVEGSLQLWEKLYVDSTDEAMRARLALVALRVSPWADAKLYRNLIRAENAQLRAMGLAGHAVASRKDVAKAVVEMIEGRYPLTSAWALQYVRDHATPEDTEPILKALIKLPMAEDENDDRDLRRAQHLEETAAATELLGRRMPRKASPFLRDLITDNEVDPEVRHMVLFGLLRANQDEAAKAIVGLKPFTSIKLENLRLVLIAKHGQPMSAQEINDLRVLIRGGGQPQPALQLQAAWAYLKRTKQVEPVLASVLKP